MRTRTLQNIPTLHFEYAEVAISAGPDNNNDQTNMC